MRLEDLPPRYRSQAERQLGLTPSAPPASAEPAERSKTALPRVSSVSPSPHTPDPSKPTHSRSLPPSRPLPSHSDLLSVAKSAVTPRRSPSPDPTSAPISNAPRKRPTLTPDKADSLVSSVAVSPDGNEVVFALAIDPHSCSTAQQKGAFVGKDNRVHFFTKAHIAKAEKTFVKAFTPYAHLTRKWGRVPYEVEFQYYFAYPSNTPKKRLHRIGPMNERPDASNITKGICDALTKAGLWEDDSLINTEISKKRRTSGTPRIVIKVRNLQPAFDKLHQAEAAPTPSTPTEENKAPANPPSPTPEPAPMPTPPPRPSPPLAQPELF